MNGEILSDWIIFGVTVSAPRRNNVDNPAERADRADPGHARQNEPQNADQNSTVINLPDAGNEKT